MEKVWLSFSTINMLYNCSHGWINKVLKREVEDKTYFQEGREAHRLIQDHVSGIKKTHYLTGWREEIYFPIVEQKQFDDNLRFRFDIDDTYGVTGFADGLNPDLLRVGEIKTSSVIWSVKKYAESMQRKVYAVGFPSYKEGLLITCSRNPRDWFLKPPRTALVPFTDRDREEALAWIKGGIAIIKNGNFKGGLDSDGYCNDWNCLYGKNCFFRRK